MAPNEEMLWYIWKDPELRILDSLIYEAVRLDCVGGTIRRVLWDTDVKGEFGHVYHLRKGKFVIADVRGMHHDKAYFRQPT